MVTVASLFFAQLEIEEFGLVRLITPVAIPLLLPALAGAGVAAACVNLARVALPNPPRAIAARGAWALTWIAVGLGASGAAILANPGTNSPGVARNLCLYAALGLLTLWLGFPHLLWLPALTYTIACMMFGYDRMRHSYHWWAVVLKPEVTVGQLSVVLPWLATCVFLYALTPLWSDLRHPAR